MSKAKNKALAEKYREAASLVEEGREKHCCFAVGKVGLSCQDLDNWFKKDAIAYSLKIRGEAAQYAYMANAMDDVYEPDYVVQNVRILALCFLAAMAEAGDLHD